jgi:hypothetical protein
MKTRIAELKRLAKRLNCVVVDDKDDCYIAVIANDECSFENGETSSQVTGYGQQVAEWRCEAISEAIDRLVDEPPCNVPFIH